MDLGDWSAHRSVICARLPRGPETPALGPRATALMLHTGPAFRPPTVWHVVSPEALGSVSTSVCFKCFRG